MKRSGFPTSAMNTAAKSSTAMLRGSSSVPGPFPFTPHAPRNSIGGGAGFVWNALVVELEQPEKIALHDAVIIKMSAGKVARMNLVSDASAWARTSAESVHLRGRA